MSVQAVRMCLAALLAAAALLCGFGAQAAALVAAVDRNEIADGEVVQLSLQVEGRGNDRPDTRPLEQDFEVLGTSNMTQMSIVNGRATSSTRWLVNLRPRRIGTLTIPSLQSGDAHSQAITIRVVRSRQARGATPDLFLESEVSPDSPYVQAQLRYTVRLFHAVGLRSGQLSEPRIGDVLIHRAGEDRSYTATRGGRQYKVIERQYALFAQQSGKLAIEAPVFEGQVVTATRGGQSLRGRLFGNDLFNGLMTSTQPVRIRGESLNLDVRPRPTTAQGRNWVPALAVEMSGQWEPQQSTMKVGEPVTMTLNITAHGLTAEQLPEVVAEQVQGFSVYPDQAELQTVFTSEGNARGTRVQKIAFIPRQAGEISIPEITLRWWNTATDQEQIASLPARMLTVTGEVAASATPVPVQNAAAPAQTAAAPASGEKAIAPTVAGEVGVFNIATTWMWASAILVLIWAVTLVMWLRDRRRIMPSPSGRNAGVESPSSDERKARAAIARACAHADAVAVRRALLAWGACHWPEVPPRGLEQIALRIDEAQLGQALLALDRALYTDAGRWNAAQLQSQLDKLPKLNSAGRVRSTSSMPHHYVPTHAS